MTEWITLSPVYTRINRRVYGLWEVTGKVGGIAGVLTLLSTFFLSKLSKIDFTISAIDEFF